MNRCSTRGSISVAFLAVVAMTAPASGEGLVSRLTGFKGGPIQKVGPTQKGGVIQKGGCSAGPRCGCESASSCGSCDPCCLLPALVAGVGNFIDNIFCCNPCNSGCSGGKSGGKGSYGPAVRTRNCGCPPLLFSRRCCSSATCGGCSGKKGGGYAPMPAAPSDPFIEDRLTPPPVHGVEARMVRPAPVHHSASVLRKNRRTPRTLSIASAQPLRKVTTSGTSRVIRANNQAESLPNNPLRK